MTDRYMFVGEMIFKLLYKTYENKKKEGVPFFLFWYETTFFSKLSLFSNLLLLLFSSKDSDLALKGPCR